MAATVRIAGVSFGAAARVRIAKVSFLTGPGGANARVRIAKVSFVTPAVTAVARVRIAKVGFFAHAALDGTPLLVEFEGDTESWRPIPGVLVMFVGGSWVPA